MTVLAATPPAADDPERLKRLLDETLASVRAVLDRYGGSLQRFGPEGLVAVFGADAARRRRRASGPSWRRVSSGCPRESRQARSSEGPERSSRARSSSPVAAGSGSTSAPPRSFAHERRLDAPLVGPHRGARLPARSARRGGRRPPLPRRHRRRRTGHRQDPPRARGSAARRRGGRRCSSRAASRMGLASRFYRCSGRFAGRSPSRRSPASRTLNWCSHRLAALADGAADGTARRVVLGRAAPARGARARRSQSCSCSTTSTGPSRRSST